MTEQQAPQPGNAEEPPEHIRRAKNAEVALAKDKLLEHFEHRATFLRAALDQAEERNAELAAEVGRLRTELLAVNPPESGEDAVQEPPSEPVDPGATDQPEGPWSADDPGPT